MKSARKVLVVDDDPINVEMLSMMIKMMGHNVDGAIGGKAALEKLREATYDAIFLDVMMPEIDGIEVCKIIRANPTSKDIPILIVTALLDDQTHVQCLEAGANVVLSKPLNFDRLNHLFDTYVGDEKKIPMDMAEAGKTLT